MTNGASDQIRVVSFGSDHPFTQPALDALFADARFAHVEHIRTSDDRQYLQDPNSERSRAFLRALEPDLFLSSGYGRILGDSTLEIASIGGINVHPSLLPEFRGRQTIQWALYEGASEVGITIHEMTRRVDGGPILAQLRLPTAGLGADDLYDRLAAVLPELLEQVLDEIYRTREIAGTPQPAGGSYRRFAWEEDQARLELDWTQPAEELIRRFRLFPFNCNMRVGPWRVYFQAAQRLQARPGTIVRRGVRWIDVIAGDGSAVRLQLKRPIRAWAKFFLSGAVSRNGHGEGSPERTLADDLLATAGASDAAKLDSHTHSHAS